MQYQHKSGITLIYLVITIIVMLILVATVIGELNVSASDAKLSAFANDTSQIQDAARAQYILNHELPYAAKGDGSPRVYTTAATVAIVEEVKREAFSKELKSNGESASAKFYELDLDKLEVDKKNYGNRENGEDDIYVISDYTLKVYYLHSIKYNKERFFSLNDKVASLVGISVDTKDTSQTLVTTHEGITVTRPSAAFTNQLGIKIIANMEAGETLKAGFWGTTDVQMKTINGANVFEFDDITKLYTSYLVSTPSGIALTEVQRAFAKLRGDNRKLIFTKYNGSQLVSKYEVDISNYDMLSPSITTTGIDSYDAMYVFNGKAVDVDDICVSGLAQVRYEFVTKKDGSAYGSTASIDNAYMKVNAKMAETTSEGTFSIKVPKDVGTMRVAAIDKTGNIQAITVTMP